MTRKRRFGFGALLGWFAILPKTKRGWQFLYRRFALWRKMMAEVLRGKSRTPWATIIALIAIALYVALPFDLIPDFFLFFGWLDDAFVVAKLFSLMKFDLRRFLKSRQIDPEPFDLQD
ncbi:MAG: DUF1232 domain-containing protein [bacterium]|nr:DUF1232 domain-containing protein [bacterium]MBK8127793.1 DUF1232 domain-containing protein [bacterium]